jgi:hypothetical protein
MEVLKVPFYSGRAIIYMINNLKYNVVKMDIKGQFKDFELKELKRIKDVPEYRKMVMGKILSHENVEKVELNFPDNISDIENINCYVPELENVQIEKIYEKSSKNTYNSNKQKQKSDNKQNEPSRSGSSYSKPFKKSAQFQPRANYSSSGSFGRNDWTKPVSGVKDRLANDSFTRHIVYIAVGFVIIGLIMAASKGLLPESMTEAVSTTSQYTLMFIVGGLLTLLLGGLVWRIAKFLFSAFIGLLTLCGIIWLIIFFFQIWNNRF